MEEFIYRVATAAPAFLFAISFHEYAHAWVAHRYGDPTAKNMGRLSMNPVVHYDLFGTIILPLVLAAIGGGVFGYAKPVPIDPRYFKNYKKSVFWVSAAGPLANVVLVIFSAFFFSLVQTQMPPTFSFYAVLLDMLRMSVFVNILLAVFNLIPFPPLDGSRMLSAFLNYNNARRYEQLQRFSFLFFILLWTTNILSYLMKPAFFLGGILIQVFHSLFT